LITPKVASSMIIPAPITPNAIAAIAFILSNPKIQAIKVQSMLLFQQRNSHKIANAR